LSTENDKQEKNFIVRKYRPEDRERVRWICSETGFVGKPQEAIFIGRDEFADMWSSYWTDREPESAFVAEAEGEVRGYLLGCVDTHRQEKIWSKEIMPAAAKRLLRPRWLKYGINRMYVYAMLRSIIKGELKVPINRIIAEYPAHLHTNIAGPEWRGKGLGKAMMEAYFDYLREKGVPGVHLGTTSHNREAIPFYEHMGFKTLVKKRATMYDHAIDDPPLYLIYMGKKL